MRYKVTRPDVERACRVYPTYTMAAQALGITYRHLCRLRHRYHICEPCSLAKDQTEWVRFDLAMFE